MNLTDKVALITGGKRIGLVVAGDLAGRGVDIAVSYARSQAEAERAVATVNAAKRRAAAFRADLSQPDAAAALVQSVVDTFGRLDILINMASVYARHSFADLTAADWDAVMNVDLRAAFLCAHAAAPHMRRQGGGRIINFSDWVASSGRPRYTGYLPYYVAKGGIIALTEALALELAADGIRVNCVCPAGVDTPLMRDWAATLPDPEKTLRAQAAMHLTNRLATPREIAAVIAFLASDAASFITGVALPVDGGATLGYRRA